MKKEMRAKAIELRITKHMSYSAIKEKLGVPKSTLSYWLKDHPLSDKKILELRRKGWKKGEASRERYRNTMRVKKEEKAKEVYNLEKKNLQKISKQTSYVAGLILYAAEGAKKDPYRIALANTDPAILLFYKHWLKTFLNVPESKIRSQLHLYEDMDISKEEKFWRDTLGLQKDQFYKTQVRRLQTNSFIYKGSYRHGTATIEISSGKKKMKIMMAIKAFMDLHS
ncbi:hypothetical protein N8083_01290 [Candidatus Pacebacteria bacterium]|nr:hypothetical protein [Candidatus Paceibacterota bacterium]